MARYRADPRVAEGFGPGADRSAGGRGRGRPRRAGGVPYIVQQGGRFPTHDPQLVLEDGRTLAPPAGKDRAGGGSLGPGLPVRGGPNIVEKGGSLGAAEDPK